MNIIRQTSYTFDTIAYNLIHKNYSVVLRNVFNALWMYFEEICIVLKKTSEMNSTQLIFSYGDVKKKNYLVSTWVGI